MSRQWAQKKSGSNSSMPVQKSSSKQRPFSDPIYDAPAPKQTPSVQAKRPFDWSRVTVEAPSRAGVQAKLSVGAPGDKYEPVADAIANKVMTMPAPENEEPIQREAAPEEKKEDEVQTKPLAAAIAPLVQRETTPEEKKEEEVQTKPHSGSIQREMASEEKKEEEVQTKPHSGSIQREMASEEKKEEEVQTKPHSGSIQREMAPEENFEEEVQAKSHSGSIQREMAPEENFEEEVQTKPHSGSIQREMAPEENFEEEVQAKAAPEGKSQASGNVESQLSASKGRGSPLSDEVRGFMEPRFGADFSSVRVHTDGAAVQMNKELGAQAFAHGSDIYFGSGKSPGKDELTAHELTHVVQQTGGVQTFSRPNSRLQSKLKPSLVKAGGFEPQLKTVSSPTIQRFESNEHKAMGDKATQEMVELAPGLKVTFGDLTAIADFFGSVDQIKQLASSPQGLEEIKYVIYVKIRGQKNRESEFSEDTIKKVTGRYYKLAGSNYTHFTNPQEGDQNRDFKDKVKDEAVEKDAQGNPVIGPDGKPKKVPVNNAGSYRKNHELALKAAFEAGKKGQPKDEAMLYEGFASHFLTDAYAAGHMRPERISIKEHWDKKVPMFWVNLKWWMAECIANHLNNQSGVAQIFTEQVLWEQARKTFNEVVSAKGIPDLTFGDAISGAVHDNDNEEGVNAQVGNEVVKLVGDGQVLDEKNRALAAGSDTMAKAVAGVKASLQEVEAAYKGQEPSSLQINGIYRAEQLWPKALDDSDPKQENKRLKWKVDSVEELMADPKMKEAIAKFANEKAEILGAEIQMEKPLRAEKELAMREGALARLKGSADSVANTFVQILNYTPGSIAWLGGVGGYDTDDNAVEYYQEAIKTKGGIESLTHKQREKLIQDVLKGATMGDEQAMVVELLKTATSEQATQLIGKIGWHKLWKEIDGDTCRKLIQSVGPTYWAAQSYEHKRAEVEFLANGRTNDLAQETIIIILRTCTPEEVKLMDDEVGGVMGLSFDLDGKWNKEFKTMKGK
ncbi:eCIS core domain-containing protein [Microseira wollei]|uniref:eCIS core domain-containing protein n=1 Tax=Microseira wollei NIES-4236 TaxID=2530354 RepID=A0AAV3WFG6_9CYAN|nr:DUF4157 domain-containing protein [Microseira wollei]GET36579.1 hypothetical protein MiSe_13300 [Microseira wollei NIES-4236]